MKVFSVNTLMGSISIPLFLVTLLFSATSWSQTEQGLIRDISEISRKIRQSVVHTTSSRSDLMEARNLLEDALDLIERGSHQSYQPDSDCFKFAYEKYYISLNSEPATDKAIAACKIIEDLPFARYAYQKFSISMNAAPAMDKAAQAAGPGTRGKIDMAQFAYEKYYISLNAAPAMERAAQGIKRVPRGSLSCLQEAYKRYYVSLNAAPAMDKAFEACAR